MREFSSCWRERGRDGIEGGVSNSREGAAFMNVCVHVSMCRCVREGEGKLGEVSHPCSGW